MGLPEILRKEADSLLDRASREPSWERQEELSARADHMLNRARELEQQQANTFGQRSRLMQDLADTEDPVLKLKIQAAIDALNYEREGLND